MEQFVLGLFQEQLSKFIIGFRKEQVNANLLNGKGSIQDILLNCSVLNEHVRKVISTPTMRPNVEFERVHVSHLSCKVTSWTNIRHSPIVISVGHITAVLKEPPQQCDTPPTPTTQQQQQPLRRPRVRQLTARELQTLVDTKVLPKPLVSAYNLLDRILDNVTIELQSISVTFTPLGKQPLRLPLSPPPAIRLQLYGVRLVSVNEHGNEGSPDEVWRHNHASRRHQQHNRSGAASSVWIYKKISCDYQVSLVTRRRRLRGPDEDSTATTDTNPMPITASTADPVPLDDDELEIPLVSSTPLRVRSGVASTLVSSNHNRANYSPETKLEVQLAYQRRLRTSEFVKVQLDATIPRVELELVASTLPLLVQLLVALHHCLVQQQIVKVAAAVTATEPHDTTPTVSVSVGTVATETCDESTSTKQITPDETTATTPMAPQSDSNSTRMVNDVDDKVIATVDSGETNSTIASSEEIPSTGGASHILLDSPSLLDLALEDGMSEASEDDGMYSQSHDAGSNNDDLNDPSENDNGGEIEEVRNTPTLHVLDEREPTEIPKTTTIPAVATFGSTRRPTTHHERPKLVFPNGWIIHEKLSIRVSIHKASIFGIYTKSRDEGHVEITLKDVVVEALWPTVTNEKGGYIQASLSHVCMQDLYAQRLRTVLTGGARAKSKLPFDDESSIPLNELNSDESFPFFENRNVRPDSVGLAQTLSSEALGVKLTVNIKKKAHSESATALDDEVMLLCEVGLDQFEFELDASPWCRIAQFALNLPVGNEGYDPCCLSGDLDDCGSIDIPLESALLDTGQLASTLFQLSDSINATVRATNITAKIPAPISESLRTCDIVIRSSEVVLTISSALPRTLFAENDPSQPESLEFPNDPSDDVCTFYSVDDASLSQVDAYAITFRCQQKIKGLTCQLVPVLPSFVSFLSQKFLLTTDMTILLCLEAESSEQSANLGSTKVVSLLSLVIYRMKVNLDFDRLGAMLTTLIIQHKTVQKSVLISDAPAVPAIPYEDQILPFETDVSKWTTLPHRRQLRKLLKSLGIETNLLHVACDLRVADFRMCHWLNTALTPPSVSGLAVPLFEASLNDFEVNLHDTISSDDSHCLIKVCLAELDFKVGGIDSTSRGDEMVPVFDCSARKKQHALVVRIDEVQRNTRTWALSAELLDGTLHCFLEDLVSFISISYDAFSASFFYEILKNHAVAFVSHVGATFVEESDSSEVLTKIKSFVYGQTALVDVVLIRLNLNDFRVRIPTASKHVNSFYGIELRVWDLEFLASFFASDGMESSNIIDVITRQQERWPSIVSNCRKGLRHNLKSCQSLHVLSSDADAVERRLADTFDFSSSCGEMHSLDDDQGKATHVGADVFEALFHAVRWGRDVLSKIGRVHINPSNVHAPGSLPPDESLTGPAFFRQMMVWVRTLRDTLTEQNNLMATILASRESEIDALRLSLFVKENERVTALALVSSEASGWLRLGSSSQSSQRSFASCVFWPHWTVLRGSLLILYAGPGQCRVLGIISLRNASLHDLEGSQRSVDLKRAFAVADHSGTLHFAIAGSDAEFITWVVAIKRAVKCFSTVDATPESDNCDQKDADAAGDVIANGTAGSEMCMSSLDLPPTAAEAGTEEPTHQLSVLNPHQPSRETESDAITGGINDRGKQLLRNRFANVRQATKSRLESAISVAKQKGIEVAAKGKEIVHKGRDVAANEDVEASYAVSPPVVTQSNVMWSCGSCTYLNAASDSKCAMCGSDRPLLESRGGNQNQASCIVYEKEDRSRRTDDGSVDASSTGEDAAIPQENGAASEIVDRNPIGPSVGMKQRFGAVVRRAMATTDNPRLLTTRRQESRGDLPSGGPGSIKLHKIVINGPLQTPRHPFIANGLEASGVILKRLQGSRIIRVHVHAPNLSKTGHFDDKHLSDEGTKPSLTEQGERFSVDTTVDFVGQPGTTADEPAGRLADTTFRLEIMEYVVDSTVATVTSTLVKRLPDILSLQTALSESVAQIPSYLFDPDLTLFNGRNDETANNMRDMASLDLIRTTGTVLRGLLEESNQAVTNYHADCVSAFLNAMVNAPLPIDVLAGFTAFLQLNDAFTRMATGELEHQSLCSSRSTTDQNLTLARHVSDIDQLSATCEQELMRAERHWIANGTRIDASIPTATDAAAKSTHVRPLLSMRDPVHLALLRVMEERDQIHSRMVSEQLLHAHENEANAEERSHHLSQLAALKLESSKNSPKPRLEKKSLETAAAPKVPGHIQHDSDAELLSLCQQLAGEISARTAASLEVIRLQEYHALERERNDIEMQALNEHLVQLEHEQTVQRIEVQALEQERDRWRVAYEEAMMQRDDTKQR